VVQLLDNQACLETRKGYLLCIDIRSLLIHTSTKPATTLLLALYLPQHMTARRPTGYTFKVDRSSGFSALRTDLRSCATAIKSATIYGSLNMFAGLSCSSL
jgi:hypothetical protein